MESFIHCVTKISFGHLFEYQASLSIRNQPTQVSLSLSLANTLLPYTSNQATNLVEPALLLRRFRLRIGVIEEPVRGIVILDIPEVLSHGDDERSNNQNGDECRVLALLGLDLLGRLEGGSGVVVCLLGDIDLVRSVKTLAGLLHGNDVGGREGGGGGSLGRWGGAEEHIGGKGRCGEDRGGSLLHIDGGLGRNLSLGLCETQ